MRELDTCKASKEAATCSPDTGIARFEGPTPCYNLSLIVKWECYFISQQVQWGPLMEWHPWHQPCTCAARCETSSF